VYLSPKEIIQVLCGVFRESNVDDRIISKGVWPPRSPDCDFYLRGKLKNGLYANNPRDLGALKHNICEVTSFPKSALKNSGMSHSRGQSF
jgi:hypothetical protein